MKKQYISLVARAASEVARLKSRRVRLTTSAVALLATPTALLAMPVAQAKASTLPSFQQAAIILNGKTISTPPSYVANHTTYMPIWYVQQMLDALGVQNTWTGHNWILKTKSTMNVNMSSVNPGIGLDSITLNGTVVERVNGQARAPYAGAEPTTFMPIWYVQQVLNRLHITQKWDGTHWLMTTSAAGSTSTTGSTTGAASSNSTTNSGDTSTTGSTIGSSSAATSAGSTSTAAAATASISPSGITPGVVTSGASKETWYMQGSPAIKMSNLSYGAGNEIGIQGTDGTYTGDLLVQILTLQGSRAWNYSIPVANGHFSDTVTVPFGGQVQIAVGLSTTDSDDSFTMGNNFWFTDVTNSQANLSLTNLSLLQSWMVNYNESSAISQLAQSIVSPVVQQTGLTPAGKEDAEIKAVSDWVSSHIAYNFPALNANKVPWQQVTQTLQLRYGVCQDESAVAAAMLRSLGIPTELYGGTGEVNGESGPHQWDSSWDGGRWVLYDPTWDQTYYGNPTTIQLPSGINGDYFDLPASVFNQTHLDGANTDW